MGSIATTSRPKGPPTEPGPIGLEEHWPARNNLSSFVHCLHLLDLDLLEDWPGITVQTLSTRGSAQNLQYRVKAVEWSLFRLCELYDVLTTRDVGSHLKPLLIH